MKKTFIKLNWILSTQFGLDLRKFFFGLANLPFYISSYFKFKKEFNGRIEFKPCLNDRHQQGGVAESEYFLQDLFVARLVQQANPIRHIDVGSRVDGFVSNVASFREIEVVDIRPIDAKLPGIKFIQSDMTKMNPDLYECTDSVSCLHALEHFGLGRYGDQVSAVGFVDGFESIASMVKPGGVIYLAVPVGIKKVEFNANHIFDPNEIIQLFEKNNICVNTLNLVGNGSVALVNEEIQLAVDKLARQKYSLCIFIGTKAN